MLLRLAVRCRLLRWRRRLRLERIRQRREPAGKGCDLLRAGVRSRLGKRAIEQDDTQQGEQHGQAVQKLNQHSTPLTARTLRR
jgi:hypothetical protein